MGSRGRKGALSYATQLLNTNQPIRAPRSQDHPPLGPAWHTAQRAAGPAHRVHLHLRRHLPPGGQSGRPDSAVVQHRGDEPASDSHRGRGLARPPGDVAGGSSRLAPVGAPRRAGQHHHRAAPGQMPGTEPQENIWQFIRENWISNRVFSSYGESSTTAAKPGTSSPTSPGSSCPSDCATGRMGSDQWDLVLSLKASGTLSSWPSPRPPNPVENGGRGALALTATVIKPLHLLMEAEVSSHDDLAGQNAARVRDRTPRSGELVRLRDVVAEGNRPEITARLAMASQSARPAVCTRPRTRRLTPGTCSQSTVRGGSRRPTTRASSRQCHWQSASSTLAWSS